MWRRAIEWIAVSLSVHTAMVERHRQRARREAAAEHVRSKVRAHAKAWRFARSTARKLVLSANRRAAKTSTIGSEHAGARPIESDNYLVWVLCEDLAQFSRTWIERRPHGLLALLEASGLVRGNARQLERGECDYTVFRGPGYTRRIDYAWGSRIEVFSDTEKMRGTAPDVLWVDEAQKAKLEAQLRDLLADIVPAGADKAMAVILSGTPGHEVDTMFGRAAQGVTAAIEGLEDLPEALRELMAADWERHIWYSWDNPHFGSTWRARYERHVLTELARFARQYNVTAEQLGYLAGLTEETVLGVQASEIGKTLHPDILREWFGCWVREMAKYVYALPACPAAYWGTASEEITRMARGESTLEDVLAEPQAWDARLARLRAEVHPGPWRAGLGCDLGYADPFALVATASNPHVRGLYELGSAKAAGLGADKQRECLHVWLAACARLGLPVDDVVMDSSGGGARSLEDEWLRKIRDRFGVSVIGAEKGAGSVERTIKLINMDTYALLCRFLRGSPLAVEMEHLEWYYPQPDKHGRVGKRSQHKTREVAFADGSSGRPGNHCADGFRYRWRRSHHLSARRTQEQPTTPAARERATRTLALGG